MLVQPAFRQTVAVAAVKRAQIRGVERRLRTGQIVAAVGVEHFAVVFDLVGDVFQHAFGQVVTVVRHQSEADEVAVPAVHFVEAAAGDDVRQRVAAFGIVFQRQKARFAVYFRQEAV